MDVQQTDALNRESQSPSERSQEILDAAVSIFAAHGFAQTDVQEIADRVGVGKGTVYRHFGNKEALFLSAVKHSRDKLICAVDAVQNTEADPLAQLRTCMTAILRFFDQNPEIVELIIEERALFRDRRPSLFFEHDESRRCEWADRLKSMIDAGAIRDIPVPEIQDTISRFVFGAMFFNYFEGSRRSLADESNVMFDVLFSGLLPRSSETRDN
jgi:AcrR family transcriptional regulator